MRRVCSKHNPVSVTVQGVPHLIEFHEERPGVFAADLDDDVAHHLLFNVGQAGGFWTDEIPMETAHDGPLEKLAAAWATQLSHETGEEGANTEDPPPHEEEGEDNPPQDTEHKARKKKKD